MNPDRSIPERDRHTTNPAHQTEAHRAQAQRNPDGMRRGAKDAGAYIHQFVAHQLSGARPYMGMAACDALRAIAHKHGNALVDQVVNEALLMQSPTLATAPRMVVDAISAVR